jgi:hypothetical protein
MRKGLVLLAAVALVIGMLAPASADRAMTQTTDVVDQGPEGDVVAEDGATIERTDNGIKATVKMPTPESGEYAYPDPGHPEGFTLWVFIKEGEERFGAFLGAGHIVGGDTLTLSGQISTETEPFVGDSLRNPREAEVHLTVAPHGEVDDDIMLEQIQTPGGRPQHWWHAVFDSNFFVE